MSAKLLLANGKKSEMKFFTFSLIKKILFHLSVVACRAEQMWRKVRNWKVRQKSMIKRSTKSQKEFEWLSCHFLFSDIIPRWIFVKRISIQNASKCASVVCLIFGFSTIESINGLSKAELQHAICACRKHMNFQSQQAKVLFSSQGKNATLCIAF